MRKSVCLFVCLSAIYARTVQVRPTNPILLPDKKNGANPTNPYIFYNQCHQGNVISISIYFLKAKNGTFARKKRRMELQAQNFGMQIQLESVNNMGWVPSGYTSSSLCVRLKMSKMVLQKNIDLITCSFFKKSITCLQSRHFCDYISPKVS